MSETRVIIETYSRLRSAKETAKALNLSEYFVRKILYDASAMPLPRGGDYARELYGRGFSIKAIMDMTHRSSNWVHMMIPKQGRPHARWSCDEKQALRDGKPFTTNRSVNAIRIQRSRLKKQVYKKASQG